MVRWVLPVPQSWFHLSLSWTVSSITDVPGVVQEDSKGKFSHLFFQKVQEGEVYEPCECVHAGAKWLWEEKLLIPPFQRGRRWNKRRCTPRSSNWCEVPCHALHHSAFGLWDAWGQTLCVLSPVEVWPVFLTCFDALRAGMASCFSRVRVPYPPCSSQKLQAQVCRAVPLSGLPGVSSWQTLCC